MDSNIVLSIIGSAAGMIIGIVVFGQVVLAVTCPGDIGTTNDLGILLTPENQSKYLTITDPRDPSEWNKKQKKNFRDGILVPVPINSFVDEYHNKIIARVGITTEHVMNDEAYNPGKLECQSGLSTAWTVTALFPLVLFFGLFTLLSAFRYE